MNILLAQLPVGVYDLTVNSQGFKQIVQRHVELHAGEHLRQAFTLELGEQSETLTVTVEPGLLQVESAAIQDTIEQQQVINLPLKGRQFIDLVGLAPGITHAPSGTRGGALQQTGQTWGILGQRGGHNLYLVDGVSITDEYYNNQVLNPSVDDIQEFNVDQTSYGAEFGGKSGGVINVITKSGTNRLHGSVFEFVRNDIFNAKNFFNSSSVPTPPYKQNEFGGSLGGPIQTRQDIFLHELRRAKDASNANPAVYSSNRCGARRKFPGNGHHGDQSGHRDSICERHDSDRRPCGGRNPGESPACHEPVRPIE